jgi:hypothetical protein
MVLRQALGKSDIVSECTMFKFDEGYAAFMLSMC